MPLHPGVYAKLLGKKIEENKCRVWLINTGWSGGAYGTGKRMSLNYTRKMIEAVLNETIEKGGYENFPIFNFKIPKHVDGVDTTILQPENTWEDKIKYEEQRICLAELFQKNFKKFEAGVEAAIIDAGPKF
jgi:phosphoenolpyruvate carboxykinase (ATP)